MKFLSYGGWVILCLSFYHQVGRTLDIMMPSLMENREDSNENK